MNKILFQVSKKYVPKEVSQEIHTKAAPFVKWLQEAEEEESDSEEESDGDVEIEYNDRVQVTPLKPVVAAQPKKAAPEDEEGDDVDIDAI